MHEALSAMQRSRSASMALQSNCHIAIQRSEDGGIKPSSGTGERGTPARSPQGRVKVTRRSRVALSPRVLRLIILCLRSKIRNDI
ncbi:hypothetical protein AAFF_G00428120 [Aldrovandia affinis]|uniref:Uncharacterized protein n=1 Tax=Aldrovandia affinis TaxID=143900 RepID=A0AAD7S9K6_9TELE|nr:hypothetical protein AAFF_G00428120 [Aldrovandia affinis]